MGICTLSCCLSCHPPPASILQIHPQKWRPKNTNSFALGTPFLVTPPRNPKLATTAANHPPPAKISRQRGSSIPVHGDPTMLTVLAAINPCWTSMASRRTTQSSQSQSTWRFTTSSPQSTLPNFSLEVLLRMLLAVPRFTPLPHLRFQLLIQA